MRTIGLELELGQNGKVVGFICQLCGEKTLSSSLNYYGEDKRCLECVLEGEK